MYDRSSEVRDSNVTTWCNTSKRSWKDITLAGGTDLANTRSS